MQPAILERLDEELGLPHRGRLEGGDHHEGGALVLERAGDGLGSVDEAVVHRLEEQEELSDVLEELGAEDAIGDRVEGLRRHREHAAAGRDREPTEQAAREEVGHALGCLEEVDGVPGGRRVDDDQVVGAGRVDLVEPLHRDVVVALHEPAGDVLVERVGEDRVPGRGIRGVAADEVVPALLGVEHRRPQLAARLHAGLREGLRRHPGLDVAEGLQPEGVGEAPGRIDRQHEHLAAVVHCRHRGGRRGGGRLPDAAGAAVDDDLLGGEELLDRAGRRAGFRRAIRTRAPRRGGPRPGGWRGHRGCAGRGTARRAVACRRAAPRATG